MTMPAYLSDLERWNAVCARDAGARGAFVFAVRTTGVYCRPDCAARRPLCDNVCFFDDAAAAVAAGFRACKRCLPDDVPGAAQIALVDAACRTIARAERAPTLAELAGAAGRSPFYFQRLFKRIVGVSPREYAAARRIEDFRDRLSGCRSVTAAIADAGFGSSSRAYEKTAEMLGMPPSAYRRGGRGMRIVYSAAHTPLGWIAVAATERGVAAIELGAERDAVCASIRARFHAADVREDDAALADALAAVLAYVRRPSAGLRLPLDVQGTAFQHRVWQALRDIAPGARTSYAQVAAAIGRPNAARAVASACAANPAALAIPCHRVVRRDGTAGGYRWGARRKRALLEAEAR